MSSDRVERGVPSPDNSLVDVAVATALGLAVGLAAGLIVGRFSAGYDRSR